MVMVETQPGARLAENLHNLLPLLQSLTEFPERYVWPTTRRDNFIKDSIVTEDEVDLTIPTVDIAGLFSDDPAVKTKTVQQIGQACEEWGFMQVVNHGITDELYKDAAAQARKFYELPVDVKEKATFTSGLVTNTGYTGRFESYQGHVPWLETFAYYDSEIETSSLPSNWPEPIPEICKSLEEYWLRLRNIGIAVLEALAIHLGLERTTYSQQFKNSEDHRSACRLNFYPQCPRPDLTVGSGPHADPNIMTLLRADRDRGLQVRKGNIWVDVPLVASSGTVIINVGDTLEALSNGKFKSVEHRVLVEENSDRLSTVYSMLPIPHKIIEAPSDLIDEEHPSLYRPFTYAEYFENIKNIKRMKGKSAIKFVQRETSPQ